MPEGREIANQTFVHKKSKYAAVTITMAALVLLTGYSLFMKYRQTLDLNRFGKIVEVLTDYSDLILAVLLLYLQSFPFTLCLTEGGRRREIWCRWHLWRHCVWREEQHLQ